jgi:CheY-like chemotaxis protein
VVLLDIALPFLDGFEVARRLRALPRTRDALLVAATGLGRPGDVARCLLAGFDVHLLKPFDPLDLKQLLDARAAGRRREQEVGRS